MRAGADVIYQATFARDGWRGRADFLDPRRRAVRPRRLELRGLGHEARALAPSRPPCSSSTCYSQEIARDPGPHAGAAARRARHERRRDATGRATSPPSCAPRSAGSARTSRAPPDIYPWPCEHCSRCDFIPVCRKRWEDDDHLTRVASIRRDQVEKLERRRRRRRSPAWRSRRRRSTCPALAPPMLERAARPGRPAAPPPPHRRAHPPPARAGERARPRPPAAALARRPLLRHGGRPVLRARPAGSSSSSACSAREPDGTTDYTAVLGPRPRPASGKAFEQFIDFVHARARASTPTCTSTTTPPTSRRRSRG